MAHPFDDHGFGGLLQEAERLFASAVEHQRRLSNFVTRLEDNSVEEPAHSSSRDVTTAAPVPGFGAALPPIGTTVDLLTTMRQLVIAADEQQRLAGTMLAHLVRGRVANDDPERQRVRVLIVDDSDGSRETSAAILEEAGFDALTATNGLEGVIVAHYALPSVLLMDLTMPVLNGLEAARLLHASRLTRHVKIIAFTAQPDVHEESLARWFVGILAKPAAPEVIIAMVQRFASLEGFAGVDTEKAPLREPDATSGL